MKKQRVKMMVAAAIGLLSTTNVLAQQGFYFGISGGLTSADLPSKAAFDEVMGDELAGDIAALGGSVVDFGDSSLDDSDTGWGVQVGYRWNAYFAAEIGYVDLGEMLYTLDSTVSDGVETFPVEKSLLISSDGPAASVLGMFPLGEHFDIHARAGIYFGDTQFRDRALDVEFDTNITHERFDGGDKDLFYGVGAVWNINESYAVRLEYLRFADVGDEESGELDVDMITIGVLFR